MRKRFKAKLFAMSVGTGHPFFRKWGWLLVLWLALLVSGQAAISPINQMPYHVDSWTTEQGLPQNTVTSIAQTKEGYLWLGTGNGLVRFDGVRFVTFTSATTPELKSNRILKLCADSENNLWIGTEGGGLTRYAAGQFVKTYTAEDGFTENTVTDIFEDRFGTIWVGTIGGSLHRFRGGEFTSYTPKGEVTTSFIESLGQLNTGELWLAKADFFGYFTSGEFVAFQPPLEMPVKVASSSDGGFWMVEGGMLKKFKDNKFDELEWKLPVEREGVRVSTIYEDRDGYVWIGTQGNGLYRFKNGRFLNLTTHNSGLSHDNVISIFQDREGIIWAGTTGGGLNRIREGIFQVWDTDDGMSENVVNSVCQSKDGDIWVGTDGGGLNRFHDGKFIHYGRSDGLTSETVWSVLQDHEGVLWVGTLKGLFTFVDGKFTRYGLKDGLGSEDVRAIYQDRKDRIWIGTYGGGLNLSQHGRFSHFGKEEGLSNNDVRAIYEDDKSNLWIGTAGGGINIFKDSKFNGQFGQLQAPLRRQQGLPNDFIRSIYQDADGAIWIGTGAGLSRYKDDKFVNYTVKNGLPDDVISQIFEDSRGNYWFGSSKGIFRIHKWELRTFADGFTSSYNSVTYDRGDGLRSRECNGGFQPWGCKTSDGRLLFPTVRGLAIVDPNTLKLNLRWPEVVIEEVVVDGLTQPAKEVLKILPGPERVEFHYTALSFAAPRRIRFQYRLIGYDKNWVDAGFQRLAIYHNLPPGNYQFTVKAANSDGTWNPLGTSQSVVVVPPFYRTWWFLTCLGVFAAGMLIGGFRYLSIQKLKRKLILLEHQHALDKERARIAQDMHDDLGASITQIGLLSELVKRELTHPDKLVPLADRIVETTRDVVVTLDEIVWAVNPKNDTLDKLGAYLAQYGEAFFELSSIRCRLDVPTDLPNTPLSTELRHNLFLVVKEALNNIVKHANATEVWIHLKHSGKNLEISIEDNGKGFDASKADPLGNGLNNMRLRILEVGGKFEMKSELGKGTGIRMSVTIV